MNLDDFIATTLAEIARGVQRAQAENVGTEGPWISPIGRRMPALPGVVHIPIGDNETAYLQNVAFDVAVTAADKVDGEAKGGVKVLGVGLSGGTSVETQQSKASRVQFNVPMVLPGLRIVPREEKLKEDTQRANEATAARARRGPRHFSATEW